MALISVAAEREIGAPAAIAYQCITNYRDHHLHFLPAAFTNYVVESGGVGAGTVVRFRLTVGGRARDDHPVIAAPEPGRVLSESDPTAGTRTVFTVMPVAAGCRVRMETTWQSGRGVSGLLERWLAPRVLPPVYAEELARLDKYARDFACC